MRKFLVIALFVGVLLQSCADYSKIRINSLEMSRVSLKSTSDILVELKLGLNNPLGKDVYIKGMDGYIKKSGADFARIEFVGSDTVRAHGAGVYKTTFRLKVLNPMALLAAGLDLSSWKLDIYKVDAKLVLADVQGGSRRFKVRNYPLKKLINRF